MTVPCVEGKSVAAFRHGSHLPCAFTVRLEDRSIQSVSLRSSSSTPRFNIGALGCIQPFAPKSAHSPLPTRRPSTNMSHLSVGGAEYHVLIMLSSAGVDLSMRVLYCTKRSRSGTEYRSTQLRGWRNCSTGFGELKHRVGATMIKAGRTYNPGEPSQLLGVLVALGT